MSDSIELKNIRALGHYGVTEQERSKPQLLMIDIAIDLDLSKAASTDALADTLDYSQLHKQVLEIVANKSFKLLESLAQSIIDYIFADLQVETVSVRIAKPEKLESATPAVILRRARQL
jgi:dihydroneopterin aldolase